MSLEKDGKNIFADPSDPRGLSREAYYFLGGLLKHAAAITLITNPLVNSYKRLAPGYEAPNLITWSMKNRSPLIRIPASGGESTRLELRSPDPSANPYLTLALCLAAGLDGIRNRIEPPEEAGGNLYDLSKEERRAVGIERLPGNLWEAIKVFENSEFAKGVLGEHIAERYTEAKKQEWEAYCRQITAWELEEYLGKY
jgi:glutamine synthetase